MSITIKWRPASDDGKSFERGTSSEYRTLVDAFGSNTLGEEDVRVLRAMAKASDSRFYDDVADTIERIGPIKVWDEH
jgi:hypothetical protein